MRFLSSLLGVFTGLFGKKPVPFVFTGIERLEFDLLAKLDRYGRMAEAMWQNHKGSYGPEWAMAGFRLKLWNTASHTDVPADITYPDITPEGRNRILCEFLAAIEAVKAGH